MKKLIGLAAGVVLTASMAMMPASAEAITAKTVLNFDDFAAGSLMDVEGVYEDYPDVDNGLWSVTVKDGAVVAGNMKIEGSKEHFVYVPLAEGSTDWTGAKALYAYVDATGTTGVQMGIRVRAVDSTDTDIVFVPKSHRDSSQSDLEYKALYVQDANGNFVQPTEAKWHRMNLPDNYKGWVKVVLSDDTMMPQWWGDKNNEKLDLSKMTAIGFHFQGIASGSTVTLDTFAVEGLANGDVTIVEDNAGNNNNNNNTNKTTNKGATTGEAGIPALLLVALPVSAGVVFACKKRSK